MQYLTMVIHTRDNGTITVFKAQESITQSKTLWNIKGSSNSGKNQEREISFQKLFQKTKKSLHISDSSRMIKSTVKGEYNTMMGLYTKDS